MKMCSLPQQGTDIAEKVRPWDLLAQAGNSQAPIGQISHMLLPSVAQHDVAVDNSIPESGRPCRCRRSLQCQAGCLALYLGTWPVVMADLLQQLCHYFCTICWLAAVIKVFNIGILSDIRLPSKQLGRTARYNDRSDGKHLLSHFTGITFCNI